MKMLVVAPRAGLNVFSSRWAETPRGSKRGRDPMPGPKTRLPRRGTQAYATLHAREVASRWDVPVVVMRRGADFFCALAGTPLREADLVGRTVAGGTMFVYEGALDASGQADALRDAASPRIDALDAVKGDTRLRVISRS